MKYTRRWFSNIDIMMINMDKRKIRDYISLSWCLIFSWLYFPHLIFGGGNSKVRSDVRRMNHQIKVKLPYLIQLLFLLHNNSYFRSLFYYRIGPVMAMCIGWWRPGNKYFIISKTLVMGESCLIAHPFSTILNAYSIGNNFFAVIALLWVIKIMVSVLLLVIMCL